MNFMLQLMTMLGISRTDLAIKNHIEKEKNMNCEEKIGKGYLLIRKSHNHGAFLNWGEKYPHLVAALSVGLTLFVLLLYVATFFHAGKGLLKWGLTLLLGGAFSNTYDRLHRKYVVDYISFHVPCKKLRSIVFNLGDFAIMIGALLTVIAASS